MLTSRPLVTRAMQVFARRYHGEHGHFKTPTMDELPVPQGSWQAQYDANQRRYNSILALGIGAVTGAIIVAKTSGLVYLNWAPPKTLD